jgi:hypothetical protein
MIPPLDPQTGALPPGIHVATWAEIFTRYGYNPRRRRLLTGLAFALAGLRDAGCRRAYLGGSFVTAPHGYIQGLLRSYTDAVPPYSHCIAHPSRGHLQPLAYRGTSAYVLPTSLPGGTSYVWWCQRASPSIPDMGEHEHCVPQGMLHPFGTPKHRIPYHGSSQGPSQRT